MKPSTSDKYIKREGENINTSYTLFHSAVDYCRQGQCRIYNTRINTIKSFVEYTEERFDPYNPGGSLKLQSYRKDRKHQ